LIAAELVSEFNGGGLSTESGWLDLLPYETVARDRRAQCRPGLDCRLEAQLDGGEFRGSRICTPRRTHNGVYLSLLHE
jgi:hypothetical protein